MGLCTEPANWATASSWTLQDTAVVSGATVSWYSPFFGRAASCGGSGGCVPEIFPLAPYQYQWRTPYKIFKVKPDGVKEVDGVPINIGDRVVFETMWENSW